MAKKIEIEEAAERLYPINYTRGEMEMLSRHQLDNSLKQEGFIEGYKLAQEGMYSEEEVQLILDKTLIEYSDIVLADIPHWFKKFKKK